MTESCLEEEYEHLDEFGSWDEFVSWCQHMNNDMNCILMLTYEHLDEFML